MNLHWITDGFFSIEEIGRIEKPIVWSLYDMWPFAGTEHYATDTAGARWRTGYTKDNRPSNEGGIDIDRWTWQRKRATWTTPIHVVSASTWMQDRASSSALMGDWPHYRIPHIVDCDVFSPLPMDEARRRLGLETAAPLVLFLSSAGIHDQRKGWDLLDEALVAARDEHPDLEVLIVGPSEPDYEPTSGVKIHWHGVATSSQELALLYNAAEVTAVPSREDNMPLTAMEAQSCGRPVVAFNIGGLPDIVDHERSGYLAPVGKSEGIATGISLAIRDGLADGRWGDAARSHAVSAWSRAIVVDRYASMCLAGMN